MGNLVENEVEPEMAEMVVLVEFCAFATAKSTKRSIILGVKNCICIEKKSVLVQTAEVRSTTGFCGRIQQSYFKAS